MMNDQMMSIAVQDMMYNSAWCGGGLPVQPEVPGWPVAVALFLLLLALSVPLARGVREAVAVIREGVRQRGVAVTALFCLAAGYAMYAGGSKRGAGSPAADGTALRGGPAGVSMGEAAARGGEDPARGSAEPPRVVFQGVPGGSLPVCFTGNPGTLVQTVILAAIGDAADLATLVDAPETARIRVAPDGGAMPGMTRMEQSLAAQFIPAQWLVVEVDFEEPVPLESLVFGDTAGRPAWLRRWQGEIAEAVCLDAPPGADVRAGVANYLAVRWKFYGHRATPAQRLAAIEAGLNYGLVWGTLIIVR